jgi:predicted AAA+ superfamily ATPase
VYQKLFYGDLIARYNISNTLVLKLLVKKLAESVNNETSVNRIKNLIISTGASIGNNTLFDYLNYLESSYQIGTIANFYSKFSEKERSKKYYFMDTGILGLFLYDQDTKLLENQVYIELRRRGYQPYFLKRNSEVDFYIPDEQLLIQVSYSLQNPETYQREMKALKQAMKDLKIDKSYIITYGEEKTVQVEEGTIFIITAWHWLLNFTTK